MLRYTDVLAAARYLRRNSRFVVLAVATLALGLMASITAFSLLSAVFLAPSPYANAAQLWAPVMMVQEPGQAAAERSRFSYPDFDGFRESQQVFVRLAAYVGNQLPLTGPPGPDRVLSEFVTPEYFAVLGARPQTGRLFLDEGREAAEDAHSLLISDRLWKRRFGGDPAVLGKSVNVLHETFTVIGVLPAGFGGMLDETDLWFPLATLPTLWGYPDALTASDFQQLRMVGLARPDLANETVRAGIKSAGRNLPVLEGVARSVEAETLAESRRDLNLRRILVLLFAATCAVLLIASANVAGLQLVRTSLRRQEIAIRSALGATRSRVVLQTLAETGILAGIGGAIGLALSVVLLRLLIAAAPPDLPGWGLSGADMRNLFNAGVSPATLLFTFGVILLVMLFAGLIPAFEASRREAAGALREGGSSFAGAKGYSQPFGRRFLVVLQTVAAVVLLATSGLLLRSLYDLLSIDPGFQARSVIALRIESAAIYGDRAPAFHQHLLEEVGKLPAVTGVALGSCVPLNCRRTTALGSVDGRPVAPGSPPEVGTQFVSPGFFRALGIPLLTGRDFSVHDDKSSPRVVIVSQSLAQRLWPDESPIGRRLNSESDFLENEDAEVIGVVGDARLQSLTSPPLGDIYIADYQNGAAWGTLFVETREKREAIEESLQQTLRRVDPDLPFAVLGTLDEHLSRATSRNRFATAIISVIAGIALLLTLVALYGVVEQAAGARRRELALRLALGASRGNLFRLVLSQGLIPVLVGLILGAPLAWGASRWLQALLYGAGSAAPAVYMLVLLLVVAAAALACFVPARRALSIDPAAFLRSE